MGGIGNPRWILEWNLPQHCPWNYRGWYIRYFCPCVFDFSGQVANHTRWNPVPITSPIHKQIEKRAISKQLSYLFIFLRNTQLYVIHSDKRTKSISMLPKGTIYSEQGNILIGGYKRFVIKFRKLRHEFLLRCIQYSHQYKSDMSPESMKAHSEHMFWLNIW